MNIHIQIIYHVNWRLLCVRYSPGIFKLNPCLSVISLAWIIRYLCKKASKLIFHPASKYFFLVWR
jgi:hypothetical protein